MDARISQLRRAKLDDATGVCALLHSAIRHCCIDDHRNEDGVLGNWLGNKTPDTIASWLSSPRHFSIVAEIDGKLAGVAMLSRTGQIQLIYVLPDSLYTGTGKALLNALQTQVRAWNLRSVRILSTLSARPFLARNGFRLECKKISHFGIQVWCMAKRLDCTEVSYKPVCFCDAYDETPSQLSCVTGTPRRTTF